MGEIHRAILLLLVNSRIHAYIYRSLEISIFRNIISLIHISLSAFRESSLKFMTFKSANPQEHLYEAINLTLLVY